MQEALRRGSFEVDADAIADRLLARAGALGTPLN
jgi:anti-sigma28 factor (negative regulator of flagellin synthesis)